jgi:hypothetical protein
MNCALCRVELPLWYQTTYSETLETDVPTCVQCIKSNKLKPTSLKEGDRTVCLGKKAPRTRS